MAGGKKHTPEQVVNLLRQIEVAGADRKTKPAAPRGGGITEQTDYRWRKAEGRRQGDQGRRVEGMAQEDAELKRGGGGARKGEGEVGLTRAMITLDRQYGRYGYRRITVELQTAGWSMGKDRVERIWRREGLKVPQKQKPRGRLWFNDGSCVRLRPEHANHVWSYDFVSAKTHDGRTVRMLNLIDEHTRESLLVRPERRWSS